MGAPYDEETGDNIMQEPGEIIGGGGLPCGGEGAQLRQESESEAQQQAQEQAPPDYGDGSGIDIGSTDYDVFGTGLLQDREWWPRRGSRRGGIASFIFLKFYV